MHCNNEVQNDHYQPCNAIIVFTIRNTLRSFVHHLCYLALLPVVRKLRHIKGYLSTSGGIPQISAGLTVIQRFLRRRRRRCSYRHGRPTRQEVVCIGE